MTIAHKVSELGEPPRVVRTKWRLGRIAVPYFILVALVLWWGAAEAVELFVVARGSPITATVESKRITYHRQDTNYLVYYHYALDGKTHEDFEFVSEATYVEARFGQKVNGRAMPLCGHYFSETELIDAGREAKGSLAAIGMILALMLLTPVCIWQMTMRLVRTGKVAVGSITQKSIRGGKSIGYRVEYRFEADGASYRRRTSLRRKDYNSSQVGHQVTVIYDANRPSRSLIYEFCNYRVYILNHLTGQWQSAEDF